MRFSARAVIGSERRRVDVTILLALAVLVAVGATRWLDWTFQPVTVLQTAGPLVVLALLVLVVATALLRRWVPLMAVTAVFVVAAGMAVPSYFAHTRPNASRDLTVMSANLLIGGANPKQLIDAVRAHDVDVLVLTELTPDALSDLRDKGLEDWFSSSAGGARPSSFTGTMIFSRMPLTDIDNGDGPEVPDDHTPSLQPEATVDLDGTHVRIKAAHVLAPLAGDTDEWHAGLEALKGWRDEQSSTVPFVLAGDFNASHGHPVFRALADGLVNAQVDGGGGWVRTWPVVGKRVPPYVQLDHLLSRRLFLVEAGQVAIHGTDHAMVWASYSLTGAHKPKAGSPAK
jgi:endonuclease/exonuclease/phosphatase (EEP) superfamily protein YafD